MGIKAPIVSVVVGEGGSGGALALGVCDTAIMLEDAVYSVISPEGCASILWKDSAKAPEAADALKLTAGDLYNFGIVEYVFATRNNNAHSINQIHYRFDRCLMNTHYLQFQLWNQRNTDN